MPVGASALTGPLLLLQLNVAGQKLYRLEPPPERLLLNLPCVMHSIQALDSPLMTELALNWAFAPRAHELARKVIGAPLTHVLLTSGHQQRGDMK